MIKFFKKSEKLKTQNILGHFRALLAKIRPTKIKENLASISF